jgi:hypothetical protein
LMPAKALRRGRRPCFAEAIWPMPVGRQGAQRQRPAMSCWPLSCWAARF